MPKGFEFKAGDPVDEKVRAAAARGLSLAAQEILGRANQKVPIEEGTLQRSGRASVDNDELRAAITYDTPYATRQHEDMTMQHDSGRTAKWLENAVNDNADVIRNIVAQSIREQL